MITGAATGIGRALAVRLADEGARLCLADINKVALDVVAHGLSAKGCDVSAYAVDVSRHHLPVRGVVECRSE